MGMNRKIIVLIKASPEIIGKFNDEFDIVTKHEIYHIPVSALILSENQARNESVGMGRGVIEVEETGRKKLEGSVGLPRLK